MARAESYPDIKANGKRQQCVEERSSTEYKIAFARHASNDAVMGYNIKRESFPANIIAGMFNFTEAQLLEISDEKKRDVVNVSF